MALKKINAFTLIELLVVVAIIGILAAVGTPIFQGFIQDAKVATVQSDHKNFINFMQAQMAKCDISNTTRLNTSDGWKTVSCPNDAWEMAWALRGHFEYENWRTVYPGEWYAKWSTLAVHTSNDPGGKKICTGDAAGYICINRPKGRNETIKIWSITTNDQSIPNRTLSKSITWSR
jgi:prepilin-type N-terminal cleavage/methylation domain-containing protein